MQISRHARTRSRIMRGRRGILIKVIKHCEVNDALLVDRVSRIFEDEGGGLNL